jgi:hypothetical protein
VMNRFGLGRHSSSRERRDLLSASRFSLAASLIERAPNYRPSHAIGRSP